MAHNRFAHTRAFGTSRSPSTLFHLYLMLSCPPECHRLKVSRLPVYKRVLELSRERKDAIFLDVGCCCKRHN
jgi:hypothetical protein